MRPYAAYAPPARPRRALCVQLHVVQQEMSFGAEAEGKVSELVVALHQQKVTNGESLTARYMQAGHTKVFGDVEGGFIRVPKAPKPSVR